MCNECGLSDEASRRKSLPSIFTSSQVWRRRAEHWRLFQLLNHDKCLKKTKTKKHNLRYQYGCDYLPLTFHVFSLHTAQVFLSGSTISMLFLSWLNSAPWNLFCILQPTELDQGVKRWQPPGSIIQSSPLPPVKVWTSNVSTFILEEIKELIMCSLEGLFSVTVRTTSLWLAYLLITKAHFIHSVFSAGVDCSLNFHLYYDHCLQFISRQIHMSPPAWPLPLSKNNIKTRSWEDNGARQGTPGCQCQTIRGPNGGW